MAIQPFKPGDKVRMYNSRDEGIVTRIIDNNTVEVELEKDFAIPVTIMELVLVSHQEAQRMGEPKKVQNNTMQTIVSRPISLANLDIGVYLSFSDIGSSELELRLINDTEFALMVGFSTESRGTYTGRWSGLIKSKSAELLATVKKHEIEQWSNFYFHVIYYALSANHLPSPRTFSYMFKPSILAKQPKPLPFTETVGHLIQLDEPFSLEDMRMVKEKLSDKINQGPKVSAVPLSKPADEVDLHIEELTSDISKMQSGEMLRLQLSHFENALHKAMASGMSEITFIHGVGAGVLKNEIQKRLSNYSAQKDIKYFEDARKDKFGYGATYVRLK